MAPSKKQAKTLQETLKFIQQENQREGISAESIDSVRRIRRSVTTPSFSEIEKNFAADKLSMDQKKVLYNQFSWVFYEYISRLCQTYITCTNNIHTDLINNRSLIVNQWIAVLDFWQRRLYHLFIIVDGYEPEKYGESKKTVADDLKRMQEEDKTRLDWNSTVWAIFDLLNDSYFSQDVINKLKANLHQLTEKLWGAAYFKHMLESIEFPEVKEQRPDTLFQHLLLDKMNEQIKNIDQNMFDRLRVGIFEGFPGVADQLTMTTATTVTTATTAIDDDDEDSSSEENVDALQEENLRKGIGVFRPDGSISRPLLTGLRGTSLSVLISYLEGICEINMSEYGIDCINRLYSALNGALIAAVNLTTTAASVPVQATPLPNASAPIIPPCFNRTLAHAEMDSSTTAWMDDVTSVAAVVAGMGIAFAAGLVTGGLVKQGFFSCKKPCDTDRVHPLASLADTPLLVSQ